ncbi:hypothetical protein TNCV_1110491 [Trichonephila clavipes]|nr:hypothetical protein TNCV_1110491 [Trichonephila clavipes]
MIFIQKFAITCRVGLWNKQMPYFSSVSDEWSRDLKSVQVQKQRSCRAWDLDESPDPSMSKIVLRNLIISSKYYKEEEAKELLKLLQPKGTELVDGTVTARVDLLGKVIPRRAIEDKLSKLVKTSISVDGKVHALLDSGTEITVIKKDLVPEYRLKELPRFI